jgi:hypothetical protein
MTSGTERLAPIALAPGEGEALWGFGRDPRVSMRGGSARGYWGAPGIAPICCRRVSTSR